MNVVDGIGGAPHPARVPAISAAAADRGSGRFFGSEARFFGLLARGSLLLLVTLGVYRFWLTTDVRRFLWGHTEIAGDVLEYAGTARELLIGFLMAIVLLLPINGLVFLATFAPGLLKLSGIVAFVLLFALGQFAVYRARRYRLTRTIYRGVRLHQTGSAWAYALRSMLWWIGIIATAGLAYPWAVAALERYKMRHTHYGNLTGRFDGSGTRLFLRGAALWLAVVLPLVSALAAALAVVDWAGLSANLLAGGAARMRFEEIAPSLAAGVVYATAGITWGVLAAVLLYPLFRAITLRWWLSGLRLGDVAATSHLRNGQVYSLYLRFAGFALLFALGGSILGAVVFGFVGTVSDRLGQSELFEISTAAIALISYVAVMLGYSVIYQATVMIRFWRLSFETSDLTGLRSLDGVRSVAGPSSPFGEGLADALDVGGL